MPPVIEFRNVTKVFQGHYKALSGVSFEVEPGEVCAVLGPNGAGKTTSINILMGFLFPDSGEVRVFGFEPGDVRAKEKIGFLPENFAFYKHLTATELLRLHLRLSGRAATDDGLISELLRRVRLSGYENLRISKYSRGMVQRLGIAQALLADPQLLILDEPTSGLDPAGRKEVLDLLASLKDEGKTVFVSSHILPEVEQICDRVIVMDRGQMVETGRLRDLLRSDNRVEIVVDQLPEEFEREAIRLGATVSKTESAGKICGLSGVRYPAKTGDRGFAARCRIGPHQPQADPPFIGRIISAAGDGARENEMRIRAIAFTTFWDSGAQQSDSPVVRDFSLRPASGHDSSLSDERPRRVVCARIYYRNHVAAERFPGSLLAAWSAADTVAGGDEIGHNSGSVMARPVRRWEFLLGKYLGVQLLSAGLSGVYDRHDLYDGGNRRSDHTCRTLGIDCLSVGALRHLQCAGNVAGDQDASHSGICNCVADTSGGFIRDAGLHSRYFPAMGVVTLLCAASLAGIAFGISIPGYGDTGESQTNRLDSSRYGPGLRS